jgi:predicted phosphodiesterase
VNPDGCVRGTWPTNLVRTDMLIGVVTDIHDDVEHLASALELFRGWGVAFVVTLGDSCDAFTRHSRAAEVVELLRQAKAVGVWGNHDIGLCYRVDERTRRRYPAAILDFMATMKPRLVLEDCHFSHVEPSINPHDAQALWSFDDEEPLDFAGRARRSFAAVRERLVFVGHYHRWLTVSEDGSLDWSGDEPLILAGSERCFVVIGAIFQGRCGILDTDRSELCPLSC